MRRLVAAAVCAMVCMGLVRAQSQLSCPPGSTVVLSGPAAPVGDALLVRFDDRYVGGGVVKPGERYAIPLTIDPATRPGDHPIVVEQRNTRQVLAESVCVVPGASPPAQPQPTRPDQAATRTPVPTGMPVPTRTSVPTMTVSPDRSDCDPSYPDVCIASPPPSLNCGDVPHKNFRVLPPDPHGFDGNDNDGIGCEDP